VVTGAVAALFGQVEGEFVLRLDFLDERFQGGAGSGAADEHLAVADAADHVHVDHGDGLVDREDGVGDVKAGTEQAQLLAGIELKHNARFCFGRAE